MAAAGVWPHPTDLRLRLLTWRMGAADAAQGCWMSSVQTALLMWRHEGARRALG